MILARKRCQTSPLFIALNNDGVIEETSSWLFDYDEIKAIR